MPKPLHNLERPAVRGTAVVGRTLTASVGTWSAPGLSYSFRWLRNGTPIADRDRSHRVIRADRGKRLSVRVTARRTGYVAGSATSRSVPVRR